MPAPILHVAPFLWSGAGRVIARLCADQRADRTVVLVTTGSSDGLKDWPAYRRLAVRAGVSLHRADVFHRDPARFWSGVERLARLIDDLRPGVIHAHAGVPAAAAAIAREQCRSRARLVAQMYSWGPTRQPWMNAQDLWAFRQADVVVSSAQAYSRLLRAGGVTADRLVYLPWGVDLAALPCRDPRAVPAGPPIVGFVGRIEPRKQQAALVEAFGRVRRAVPGARLELVGPAADPDYAGHVSDTIARRGLGDAVTLTGMVRDVAPIVSRWSLFASLSADEGQGLAVLEAMALGVPVAARAVAGIEDFLVDGRTGWVLPQRGTAATADRLVAALANQPAPIVRRARTLVTRRYDWTSMVRRVDRLYSRGR